ncbi:DNA-formamidopyrimidine glycosylase family protein [Nocardioides flavescens]|uniref:DNA-(apurinic or apyrimidinic site) lyase n=1 Tax=Nocardioides flavescens TaxID=2691959 RepID=A0A6L7EZP3_9ACTN|nr:Fpg/Nei family DNA glycosylase [Nocardioides flavescens]
MPEGDSVYLLARKLNRASKGRLVTAASLRVPRLATRDLSGRTLLEHATWGKHLLTRFSGTDDGPPVTLHSHLLMDGEWSVVRPGKRLPTRLMPQVRVVLELETGATAYGLRLHQLELVATAEESEVVGHLGPDPLRADWRPEEATRRLLTDPSRPLVSALLDQTLMAGVGNLWANELAYVIGRSPWTPIGDLGHDGVRRLVDRAATALHHSATVPGAYQVTTGSSRRGEDHWVAGRQRRPCLRCGTVVQMADELPNDPDNRRTWWCPHCQPGPGPEGRRRRSVSSPAPR